MPHPAGGPAGATVRTGRSAPHFLLPLLLIVAVLSAAGCRAGFVKHYEYEEDVYLTLDGSATVFVNASVPALVALRGVNLDTNPRARLDRARVRALYESSVAHVTRVSTSRRDNRRFVHVRLEVADVRRLSQSPLFGWSTYLWSEDGNLIEYRQVVGLSANRGIGNVGWAGGELVAFRLHLPSKIQYHNSRTLDGQPAPVGRGNILAWEQPLNVRLQGTPLALEVRMETESILFRTLALFGAMIGLVALTFGVVIWWVARRGRNTEV